MGCVGFGSIGGDDVETDRLLDGVDPMLFVAVITTLYAVPTDKPDQVTEPEVPDGTATKVPALGVMA